MYQTREIDGFFPCLSSGRGNTGQPFHGLIVVPLPHSQFRQADLRLVFPHCGKLFHQECESFFRPQPLPGVFQAQLSKQRQRPWPPRPDGKLGGDILEQVGRFPVSSQCFKQNRLLKHQFRKHFGRTGCPGSPVNYHQCIFQPPGVLLLLGHREKDAPSVTSVPAD